MDPISIGLSIVGIGMKLFGGFSAAENSKQQAQVSQGIAADEQQVNVQKQHQMQLDAQRQQLQNIRNVQKAQAQGLAAATNQNAQFGSGLAGGQASASDQGGVNALGINQNLEIGQNIFGITGDINSKKGQLASLGGQAATNQGIASLGGAIIQSGPIIGAFGKNFGASVPGTGFGGPYV